ncbi:MAG: ATP-dependent Clp protease proteolytic subunit [Alphaproteobacteria bacterium]|nr:ATP-dependent Clp protease proteolytic subunit [Alphaproteobacteria bacterium]
MTRLDADPNVAKAVSSQLEEALLKTRYVFVVGQINDTMARDVVRQLVVLDNTSSEPINFLVSSPGGHVESGDMIHDMVKFIRSPVNMIGSGWVASAGTTIFLAAAKERRFCLPNTRFMIHQPSGGVGGQVSDIGIQARELIRVRERMVNVIARETGRPPEAVMKDIERDYWMSPEEAISYGIVSRTISHVSELADKTV